jgi:hypothetical protein
MSPRRAPEAWPDTMLVERQPEASHAASEIDDDDERDRRGHVLVTALAGGVIFLTVAGLVAVVIAHW